MGCGEPITGTPAEISLYSPSYLLRNLMALLTGRKALLVYTGRKDGLGNRVRALLSAQELARVEDRDLYYVWSTDEYFGPRMDELWRFEGGSSVSRLTSRALLPVARYRQPKGVRITSDLRRRHLWQIHSHGLPVTWEDPAWKGGAAEGTAPDGPRPWTERLRELTPVDEIADEVRSLYNAHLRGRPYVGIQVRTHAVSHAKTIESSPVEWFANRMRQIRADHPDVPFFLSCDTPEAQNQLAGEFDGCVFLTDKGGYNTVKGVRSGLVDLYLLASSQHLIGASFSSFVEMAVFLCDGVVPFERPDQPLDGDFSLSLGLAEDPLRPARR